MNNEEIRAVVETEHICVLIPSYHNEKTIVGVLHRVMMYTDNVIVVLDGEPQKACQVIADAGLKPYILSYKKNQGKGHALKEGFKEAIRRGYEYAITLDSDGQHYPEDIPLFIDAFLANRGSFLVGVRNFGHENMPGGNTFANKFSNFWFHLQTGHSLEDTQCGFRMYPLSMLNAGWVITSRYESELELLVYSAWKGVKLVPIPIRVYYPPQGERVSNFRPFQDFMRITLLNIVLTTGALCYYLPLQMIRRLCR